MTQQTMTERDMYMMGFEREYQTTLKVVKAFPAAKAEFRPCETSKNARELAFLLALGQMVPGVVATQPSILEAPGEGAPATLAEIIGALEHGHADSLAKLNKMTDAEYQAPFTIASGPKGQTSVMRRADALWFFTMDHVHHRGQFSVYLRMAGGTVPSIYGPSRDEPWA